MFDLPADASFEQGAAFLLAYLTAWIPLTRQVRRARFARARDRGRRWRGERGCPVRAGARRGRRRRGRLARRSVTTCSGSEPQRRHYDELGELEPFDVILDQVGGDVFAAGLEQLRPLGTIVGSGSRAASGRRSTPHGSSDATPRVAGSTSGG